MHSIKLLFKVILMQYDGAGYQIQLIDFDFDLDFVLYASRTRSELKK